ncbi:MAG: RNA methyltransferase [Prevotellaceae bacterium]|nr:RNA methyltransferase [Candidatus Minthosoma caballi]
MSEFKIIAKTFQGLEEVLAKELINLGANNVEIGRRMVAFTGDQEMLYKANFCLRTAVKILKPILTFKANDADEVYEEVKKLDWQQYMDSTNTFLVDSVIFSDNFRHSKFVAYRVKDAIADYWREKTGDRPNVGISNPDLRINIHIAEDEVTLSLDSSGESLHQRGYKTATVQAPINEVLAAGLVLLTGWDGECDFIDPFCGSGTILIEAALIAQNIYPGVFRKEYAFEKWKDFDEDLFDRIYNDDSQEREFDHKIYGYDINRQAVQIATNNVLNAGVKDIVSVEQRDFYEFEQPLDKAIMITNPPYGDRITTDDILDLYDTIGKNLKRNFAGNDAWIITHHEELFDKIGFRPSTKFALFNGSLECEFRKYQVFDGKLRERREEGYEMKSADDRKRNLKFKPHKKNDDGEWSAEKKTDDESHYFKSKPFKDDRRRKEEERDNRRRSKEDERDNRRAFAAEDGEARRKETREERLANRRQFFEAVDDEEEEIISRHLGKFSGRRINAKFESRGGDEGRKPFGKEGDGKRKPFSRDGEGERKPFSKEGKPFRKDGDKKPFKGGDRKFDGDRRGGRDDKRPRRDGERPGRKFDGPKGGGRPFRGKRED